VFVWLCLFGGGLVAEGRLSRMWLFRFVGKGCYLGVVLKW